MHTTTSLFNTDLSGTSKPQRIAKLEASGSEFNSGHIHEITDSQYAQSRLVLSSKFHVNGKSMLAAEYLHIHHGFTYAFRLFKEYYKIVAYKDVTQVAQDWENLQLAGANELLFDDSPRREHYDLELKFQGIPTRGDVDEMFSNFSRIRSATKQLCDVHNCLHDAVYVYNASRDGKLSLHLIYENILPNYKIMQAWANSIKGCCNDLTKELKNQLRPDMIDYSIYKSGEAFRIPGAYKDDKEDTRLKPYQYTRMEYDDDTEKEKEYEIELEKDTFKAELGCMALASFIDGFHKVPDVFLDRLVYADPSIRRSLMNRGLCTGTDRKGFEKKFVGNRGCGKREEIYGNSQKYGNSPIISF